VNQAWNTVQIPKCGSIRTSTEEGGLGLRVREAVRRTRSINPSSAGVGERSSRQKGKKGGQGAKKKENPIRPEGWPVINLMGAERKGLEVEAWKRSISLSRGGDWIPNSETGGGPEKNVEGGLGPFQPGEEKK